MEIDNIGANLPHKLSRSLVNIAGFFGFTHGSPFFSVRGFASIAAIIAAVVLLCAVFKIFRLARSGNAEMSALHQFLSVFFFVSPAFNIFIFIVVNQGVVDRFFIPFMVLYIPFAAVIFEQIEENYQPVKRAVVMCAILLFIAGQGCLNYHNLAKRDINSGRKGYVQYLLDNNLDYGFATFWNANVTTELSGGRIEMAGLSQQTKTGSSKSFSMIDILIPVKFLDSQYHKGESFLLLTASEWDTMKRRRAFSRVKPGYEDSGFVVIRYPSAQAIHQELLEQDGGSQ
jgi:hypothetical protein